jgi:DNA-binding NarL/FixJ family response regulator
MTTDPLERARAAFERQAWADAYEGLTQAAGVAPLGLDDLERLATTAFLTGRHEESEDVWISAHQAALRLGRAPRAIRCAFHVAMGLIDRGEMARGAGWLGRANHVLEEHGEDCAERGLLLVPIGLQLLDEGDFEGARAAFERASAIGARFGDVDVVTFAGLGRGRALISRGSVVEGMALLDEAMVAVTSGETTPITTGIVYCAVIEVCQRLFDLRRAQEWTSALSDWCSAQPDLVPYRGQCLVHRAEIMQLHGRWDEAFVEARQARERLSGQPAVGVAIYLEAELQRLRGRFDEAIELYRQANEFGHPPQPGLAQLRLAQGQVEVAAAAIRRQVDEVTDVVERTRLLPPFVDIALASGDVTGARAAADELAALATQLGAPLLLAASAAATGSVLLAEGDARAALPELRAARGAWQEMEAPYQAALARASIGLACRALGDHDTGVMELEAARHAFEALGAAPDEAKVRALLAVPAEAGMETEHEAGRASVLTARELEVLRLVATGRTNRAVARELVISEKTVARHVSNIFTKLDLSSRAAATAYAYEHDLV